MEQVMSTDSCAKCGKMVTTVRGNVPVETWAEAVKTPVPVLCPECSMAALERGTTD